MDDMNKSKISDISSLKSNNQKPSQYKTFRSPSKLSKSSRSFFIPQSTFWLFYWNVFCSCVSFALVVPSLWPYLAELNSDTTMLGWCVSVYSVGELFGALLLGPMHNKLGTKPTLLLSVFLGIIGSFCYGFAGFIGNNYGPYLIIIGRVLQGLWTGGEQAVETAYIGENVDKHQRTQLLSKLSTFATMGFVLGPAIGTPLEYQSFEIKGYYFSGNMMPGFFIGIVGIIMFMATLIVFDGRSRQEKMEEYRLSLSNSNVNLNDNHINNNIIQRTNQGISTIKPKLKNGYKQVSNINTNDDDEIEIDISNPNDDNNGTNKNKDKYNLSILTENQDFLSVSKCGVVVSCFIFLVHFEGFAIQETITTVLVEDSFNWSQFDANYLFIGAGLLTMIIIMLVMFLSKILSDYTLLLLSLIIGLIGHSSLVDWNFLFSNLFYNDEQFLFGFCFITIAFSLGRLCTLSMYSKILGPHPQGNYMGWMFTMGAISRIFAPLFAVKLYLINGPSLLFGTSAILFLIALIMLIFSYKFVQPHSQIDLIEIDFQNLKDFNQNENKNINKENKINLQEGRVHVIESESEGENENENETDITTPIHKIRFHSNQIQSMEPESPISIENVNRLGVLNQVIGMDTTPPRAPSILVMTKSKSVDSHQNVSKRVRTVKLSDSSDKSN